MHEGLSRRSEQQESANQSTGDASSDQGNHDSTWKVKTISIGAATGAGSDPEGNRVGRVGGNRWNASEQERGKGDKASASRDCIERSTQNARDEEK